MSCELVRGSIVHWTSFRHIWTSFFHIWITTYTCNVERSQFDNFNKERKPDVIFTLSREFTGEFTLHYRNELQSSQFEPFDLLDIFILCIFSRRIQSHQQMCPGFTQIHSIFYSDGRSSQLLKKYFAYEPCLSP